MNRLPSSPPYWKPIPAEEVRVGYRLTEALLALATEHSREHGASIPPTRRDAIIVGALVSALASIGAAVARAHRFDLAQYEEFLSGYVARAFQAESSRPFFN